jgi:hypothetical protein
MLRGQRAAQISSFFERRLPRMNQTIQEPIGAAVNSMSIQGPSSFRAPHWLTAFAISIVLLPSAAGLHAQDTFRRLTGTVSDASHEPLAGAVVELHDDSTDSVISYITNRSGRYTFPRFSGQDDYHVWARFRGSQSRSRILSKFDSKPTRNINLVIKLQ